MIEKLIEEQVLNNLVGNVIEQPAEGGSVRVSHKASAKELTLGIWDNSRGIAKDKINEIFDIYGKDKKKIRGKKSIGLGLSISRKIVEAYQ